MYRNESDKKFRPEVLVIRFRTLKNEARDIVEIFFELFEYSEEEKDVILHQNRKEKKFLGFFWSKLKVGFDRCLWEGNIIIDFAVVFLFL